MESILGYNKSKLTNIQIFQNNQLPFFKQNYSKSFLYKICYASALLSVTKTYHFLLFFY